MTDTLTVDWTERRDIRSWGRPATGKHDFQEIYDRYAKVPKAPSGQSLLAIGNRRSYGDSCLNLGNALIGTRGLDRFIEFDLVGGVLRCEAGVLLSEILDLVIPVGWFLPVLPGTRFVTVGGAIANDIHGKNHHEAGSFGHHVRALTLLRSDGTSLECSASRNAELFAATVGGLGLTGVIVEATIALRRVPSPWLQVELRRFETLEQFEEMSAVAEASHEHVVAWLDTSGREFRRGILMQARHAVAPEMQAASRATGAAPRLSMPFTPPFPLVTRPGVRAFNAAYLHRVPSGGVTRLMHAYPFMFPLDGIRHWNRIYGVRGFFQYQCVVPQADAAKVVKELLSVIAKSGQCAFLSVLKRLGGKAPAGMLSFVREGWTLALDFPDTGEPVLRLLDALDVRVAAAGGRLYPAKDARMGGAMFRQGYPAWQAFARHVDPAFSSSFWRRVSST